MKFCLVKFNFFNCIYVQNIEFTQQYKEINKNAVELQQIHRRRRFHFYENNNVKQPMNIINLQNRYAIFSYLYYKLILSYRILTHLQLIYNLIPKLPDRTRVIPYLETLLNKYV